MATKTKQKAAAVEVTVAKFTDTTRPFTVLRDAQPIAEYATVGEADYWPRGHDTPLRDATARFIAHLEGKRRKGAVTIGLLLDESGSMNGKQQSVWDGVHEFVAGMAEVEEVDPDADGKVLAVILTDGLENASREVSAEALRDLIAARERDGWTFIYLGTDQDAWAVGTSTGFSGTSSGSTRQYQNSAQGTRSALRATTNEAREFVTCNAQYMASSPGAASIAEDGQVKPIATGGGVPEPTPDPLGIREQTRQAVRRARRS